MGQSRSKLNAANRRDAELQLQEEHAEKTEDPGFQHHLFLIGNGLNQVSQAPFPNFTTALINLSALDSMGATSSAILSTQAVPRRTSQDCVGAFTHHNLPPPPSPSPNPGGDGSDAINPLTTKASCLSVTAEGSQDTVPAQADESASAPVSLMCATVLQALQHSPRPASTILLSALQASPLPVAGSRPDVTPGVQGPLVSGSALSVTLPLQQVLAALSELRAAVPTAFMVLWHPDATEDPALRVAAFAAGASMVTFCEQDVRLAFTRVATQTGQGLVQCGYCGLGHLTALDFHTHQPLYHIYAKNRATLCQVCDKEVSNLAVHTHEQHGPNGPHPEVRTNAGTAVIVHRPADNKFLMVQEFAEQGFWLPGGGNDPGEGLRACGVRECFEEAGVKCELKALLEVDYDLTPSPPWRLAVVYAVPTPGLVQQCKTVPDFESAGACWVSLEQLMSGIPLRSPDLPFKWFKAVAEGTAELLPLRFPKYARKVFKGLKM